MSASHRRTTLGLYRRLMKLATKYPESEFAWEYGKVPMSDELRVEIRESFKENALEQDPLRVKKCISEGKRLQNMLEVVLQDGFFRMYPTNRQYHMWQGLSSRELLDLKEKPK
eukprot:TRINITY_DN11889_c0_g1_i1.p1 TRINITY_DN11889_c0_g1~~TRINITY_DN11889_c0_g1_i1.p1  ORF type:complete len:127 (+),score=22.84 TRINITY_DN11889_c0_g1_i1:44-382(+)